MQINNISCQSFGRLKFESPKAVQKLERNIEKLSDVDKDFAQTALAVIKDMNGHDLYVSNKGRLTIINNSEENRGEKTEIGKDIIKAFKEIIYDDRRAGVFERLKARMEKRPLSEIKEMEVERELLYKPLEKFNEYI